MYGVLAFLLVFIVTMIAVGVYVDPHNDTEYMRNHDTERCPYCNGHVYPFV